MGRIRFRGLGFDVAPQFFQLDQKRLGQFVGAGADDLAELYKGGSEFFECVADALVGGEVGDLLADEVSE